MSAEPLSLGSTIAGNLKNVKPFLVHRGIAIYEGIEII